MIAWNKNQRQLAAEFLSNTAVLVIGIGLVNPLFFPIKDVIQIVKQGFFSLAGVIFLLTISYFILRQK